MTVEHCLLCACQLTKWTKKVDTIDNQRKLLNAFCSFLDIGNRDTDNIFGFCSNCVCFVEEISFNYDLIESVYKRVLSIYQNINGIIKQTQNIDLNNSGDDDYKNYLSFRQNVSQSIQNVTQDKNLPSVLNRMKNSNEQTRTKNEVEDDDEFLETDKEEDEEEKSEDGVDFNSFVVENVQKLWTESINTSNSKRRRICDEESKNSCENDSDENKSNFVNDDESDNSNNFSNNDLNNDNDDNSTNKSSDEEMNSNSNEQAEYEKRHWDKRRKKQMISSSSSKNKRTSRRANRKLPPRSRSQACYNLTETEDDGFIYNQKFKVDRVEDTEFFKCAECPQEKEGTASKLYSCFSDVIEHVEEFHLGNKLKGPPSRPCQICGQMIRGPRSTMHILVNHGKRKLKKNSCRVCDFVVPTVKELENHQKESHPQIYKEALARLPAPSREPVFTMEKGEDGKYFYRGFEITVIEGENENEQLFKCALCPERPATKQKQQVFNHIRYLHTESCEDGRHNFLGVEVVVENGLLRCSLCPDRAPYKAKRNVINHIKDHHLEREKPWIPCEKCGKEYRTQSLLNMHMKTHENPEYNIICDTCGKAFNSESVLRRHKRIVHEGLAPPKKFQCAVCGNKFTNETLLEIHSRIHLGQLPFKCEACEMSFRAEKFRRVHYRRSHATETPFKCNFCTEAFHDSTFVINHLKNSHPEVKDRRKGIGYQIIYRPIVNKELA